MTVLVDSTSIVSGSLSRRRASAAIMHAVRLDHLRMAWNESTRQETDRIMHQIPPLRNHSIATLFRAEGRFDGAVDLERFIAIPDPDDRKFAALAHAAGAVLVSNDAHLLESSGDDELTVFNAGAFRSRYLGAEEGAPETR